MMEYEIWKPTIGHEGYEVSNLGRVRSFRPLNGRGAMLLTPRILKEDIYKGYIRIHIDRKMIFAHKLVLIAFAEPPKTGETQCRHLDGNKSNNCISNLKWGTPKENGLDKVRLGEAARGEKNGHYTKPEKTPRGLAHSIAIKMKMPKGLNAYNSAFTEWDIRFIKYWKFCGYSRKDISKVFEVSLSSIDRIFSGKTYGDVT